MYYYAEEYYVRQGSLHRPTRDEIIDGLRFRSVLPRTDAAHGLIPRQCRLPRN